MAGALWLFGLYRLPGAMLHSVTHVGRVPVVLGLIVAAGLIMGAVAH